MRVSKFKTKLLALLAAIAGGVVSAAAGSAPSSRPMGAVPLVDYHQHLMSPAVAALATGEGPLPAIELPPELASLLSARSQAWNDPTALAGMFATDGVILTDQRRGWLRGNSAIAAFLSSRFGRPYGLTAVAFHQGANFAEISGYYTRGEAASPQYLGYFSLTAVKDPSGWRIVSEVPRFPFTEAIATRTADELVAMMDQAGIRRAIVLSEAFWTDGPYLHASDPEAAVVAENDWTADQVARHPNRLIAFCSFSPLSEFALRELDRCASRPEFRGLKFSFAMSGVDLTKPEHATRVRAIFAAANRHRLSIVVHLRNGGSYSPEHVRIFLDEIIPAAPEIPVQVAHLWGGEAFSDAVLGALADAVSARHPGTRNLFFDVAEAWNVEAPDAQETIARRIRQIGLERVLFGADGKTPPRQAWAAFRTNIPLSDREFRSIADNVTPYAAPAR